MIIIRQPRYRLIESPAIVENGGRVATVTTLLVLAIWWGWAAMVPIVAAIATMAGLRIAGGTRDKTFDSLDELREFLRKAEGQT